MRPQADCVRATSGVLRAPPTTYPMTGNVAIHPSGARLNPYSGKWNFEGLDDDTLVGRAIYWIERVAS